MQNILGGISGGLMKKVKIELFFLLLVLSALGQAARADTNLKVEKERDRIDKFCRVQNDPTSKAKCEDQLALLIVHQRQQSGKNKEIISRDFENRLFRYLEFFRYRLDQDIFLDSLYSMIRKIEDSKENWKANLSSKPEDRRELIALTYKDGTQRTVAVEWDLEKNLYLNFVWENPHIGSFKKIEKVLLYEDLKPAMRLTPLKDSDSKSQENILRVFETEVNMLRQVGSLKKSKRVGLVKNYSISNLVVYQKYFPGDLLDSVFSGESIPALTAERKFELLRQLASGLVVLHNEKKMVHNDIKPENVLVNLSRMHRLKGVWIDFGLAFLASPEVFTNKYRPLDGTPFYLPPEMKSREWIGDTPEERMDSAFKSDVFALTTIALALQDTNAIPWNDVCDDLDFKCKEVRIGIYQNEIAKEANYSSYKQLIIAGLYQTPQVRIAAKQFLKGIEHLIEKEKRSREFNFLKSADEVLKSTVDFLISRISAMGLQKRCSMSRKKGRII
jgi:hypothetical protein